MTKTEVVELLVRIVSRADIAAIQEVRSISSAPVEEFMALMQENYSYILGPRQGRTGSKEQYWVIYKTEKFTPVASAIWPDEQDIFERSPIGVYFKTDKQFDFILIVNHIQPSAADKEIRALPDVLAYFQELWDEKDVLLVGDFNADGAYYNEALLESVFPRERYTIIITNDYDTSVAGSENTYDRFIITSSAVEDYTGNFGVLRFDEVYDFSAYAIEPKAVSDHYPVWAEFRLDNDTD
jgi:endonuclease/exonuclease/phosphatase family metal-dependent hydrolase